MYDEDNVRDFTRREHRPSSRISTRCGGQNDLNIDNSTQAWLISFQHQVHHFPHSCSCVLFHRWSKWYTLSTRACIITFVLKLASGWKLETGSLWSCWWSIGDEGVHSVLEVHGFMPNPWNVRDDQTNWKEVSTITLVSQLSTTSKSHSTPKYDAYHDKLYKTTTCCLSVEFYKILVHVSSICEP